MADVRLTATNPEDSSVVPVACDASGRLLLEEQGQGPPGPEGPPGPKGDDGKDGDPFSGNFAGDVTFGGSAEFAGEIKVQGTNTPSGRWSGINKYGSLLIGTTSEAVGDARVSIDSSNGSAEFAGGKAGFTAEGYLWCTTRRGDTVILDATSNGLASWVEYTPTTRIDDLRDRLDAIRPDTGEMPADAP